MTTNWFSVCKALVVRWVLTCHVILCTWRVVEDLRDHMYWLLLCCLLPLFCESCYTIIRRQGVEFTRFTPCFFFYLGAVLPGIWLLELDKTDLFITGKQSHLSQLYNSSEEQNCSFCLSQEISLSPITWIIVIEEMLPYVIFLSRWILPRGRVKREELAELLFAFIEIAADIMEFFSLFGEPVIRSNKTLAYCVLSIWSLAVLQFTMTFTVIHKPKKEKKIKAVVEESNNEKEFERIRHECYAIFLTIMMQDLPFAMMRLYTIIKFNYINYSLIFFTSKNLIIIMLLLYKVAALCKKQYCPDPEDRVSDTETVRGGLEMDHAEQSTKNGSFGSLNHISINMDTAEVIQDEHETPYSSVSKFVESGLKKRCNKYDATKESLDSKQDTLQNISQPKTDITTETACDTSEASGRYSPNLYFSRSVEDESVSGKSQKPDSMSVIPAKLDQLQ